MVLRLTVHGLSTDSSVTEIQADVQVVKQLLDLEASFSRMLTSIRRIYAGCDCEEMQFFFDDFLGSEEFRNCDTFDALLRRLRQNHVDTFNIYCLEKLAVHFPRDGVDELIEEYSTMKDSFLKKQTVCDFQRAISSRVEPALPNGMAKITIKIPQYLANKNTLKDMEVLAGKAFGDYYKSFVRLNVVAGSILVSWIFPSILVAQLQQLAMTNAAVFTSAEVETVMVSGIVVFVNTQKGTGKVRNDLH